MTFQQACDIISLVEISTRRMVVMEERFGTFTVLIAKISRSIRKIKNQEMADYGFKSQHVSCLYYLYREGGLNATELCERCEEDKATISRSLNYLEENGYLVCDCKNTKRYKSNLILTEKGKEAGKKIADKISNVLDEVSVGLSDEERTEFYRGLKIITDNLTNISSKYDK